VVFHDFFKKIGFENFQVYIPDRSQEGYGLNLKVIDEFIKKKVNLIITVDCGITDKEEIEKANKAGIEVIITDHHLPPKILPPAFALMDAFVESETYPFKQFCGTGLAFKVVSALVKNESFKIVPGWEKWLLDVVAIATVADYSSLIDENRVLVSDGLKVLKGDLKGLKNLKKTRRQGLLSLFQKLQINISNITEDDIGFLIAPCLNVAGRMEHATISFSLLTTESMEEAEALSRKLMEMNNERKKKTEEIFKEIELKLAEKKELPEILVLGDEKWPIGILAPLCNKVLEKYSQPVIIWGKGDTEEIKGSCRSNGRINLVELLNEIGDKVFIEFGGHAEAAGFTIKEDKVSDLEKEVGRVYDKISHQEIESPVLWLDAELDLKNIDWNLINLLEKFRPFGISNPKPVFLLSGLEIFEIRTFGNGGIHLKLNFRKPSGEVVSAIGFFMQQRLDFPLPTLPTGQAGGRQAIEKGAKIDLAASVEKNTFNGHTELRLRIVDIRPAR
ncbi:MAG: single-stranded-DNA-specific exonuclease RecJ, partial [Candidatus Tagabacteria bacterium]